MCNNRMILLLCYDYTMGSVWVNVRQLLPCICYTNINSFIYQDKLSLCFFVKTSDPWCHNPLALFIYLSCQTVKYLVFMLKTGFTEFYFCNVPTLRGGAYRFAIVRLSVRKKIFHDIGRKLEALISFGHISSFLSKSCSLILFPYIFRKFKLNLSLVPIALTLRFRHLLFVTRTSR